MDELKRSIEATLFASAAPLTVEEIAEHVGEGEIEIALGQLAADYEGRGMELVERGGRWHFQTAPDLAHLLRRTREEPRKLSRAATETLAIIAYHEPVSRAEIEAKSEYVGPRFPEEARKIHYEETPARGIYGEATREEAKALSEEGIEFFPLPILPEDQN